MIKHDRWLLPEGIRETLSPEALAIEHNRRAILDMYYSRGYELVRPPLIDYRDALLSGTGHDLEIMTFTLTDQLSGKLLGIRADMTPQVSRIDAHYVKSDHPTRFCYLGEVLHTRLDGFSRSRCPIQTGAEIYGHAGFQSDVEIIRLMIDTLRMVGVSEISIDLGHVGIFRRLASLAGIPQASSAQLFEAVQRKAVTDIQELLDSLDIHGEQQQYFVKLIELQGDESILTEAQLIFDDSLIHDYLQNLKSIASALARTMPDINLFFDLSELRGFNYHTGVVFSAYTPDCGQSIAQGGRYDGIGENFGRSRAATGFSTDLAQLVDITRVNEAIEEKIRTRAIFAPYLDPAEASQSEQRIQLENTIEKLRKQGERVVCELPGQVIDLIAMGCDRHLVFENSSWIVKLI